MLLPERMISTSVTCVKNDVEEVLETLSNFGEFHIIKEAQDDIDQSEYRNIIQNAEEAIINVDALIKQFANEKESLFDLFKEEKTTKTVVTANNWQTLAESTIQKISTVFKETEEIKNELNLLGKEKEQLINTKDKLAIMETINADFTSMKELNLIHVIFASVPTRNIEGLQTALANKPVYFSHHKLGKNSNFICIAIPDTNYTDIDKLLKTYHAETFQIPKNLPDNTTEAIEELTNQLKANDEKEKELTKKLNKIGEDNKKDFTIWKETAENFLLLFSTKTKIIQSGPYATIKGYTPEAKFNELNSALNKNLDGRIVVIKNKEETPTTGEHEGHETHAKPMPPTKIKNNRFIRPFEELTKLYGMPKYNEIDPTPFMAFSFPIIFGLMFGDLGHGLLLLIGGLIAGTLIKKSKGMKNLCYILAACGFAACVTGILFGEFFGQQIFAPLWYSPAHNIFDFLIFCMYVGIAQIMLGIALEMGNYIANRKFADTVFTAIPKMAFFAGCIYIIYNYQINFNAWLSGPILAAIIPFIILVVGKPAYLAIAKPAMHKHEENDSPINRLFEGGDFFTRLLGNTISYSRILALLMAHWALMLVVYEIAGIIGTASILATILSTIIIIVGNIGVLALEGLIVFIHTLRLHFYEWFSKFYIGSGSAFTPFKKKQTYTNVVFEKEQKETNNKQQ